MARLRIRVPTTESTLSDASEMDAQDTPPKRLAQAIFSSFTYKAQQYHAPSGSKALVPCQKMHLRAKSSNPSNEGPPAASTGAFVVCTTDRQGRCPRGPATARFAEGWCSPRTWQNKGTQMTGAPNHTSPKVWSLARPFAVAQPLRARLDRLGTSPGSTGVIHRQLESLPRCDSAGALGRHHDAYLAANFRGDLPVCECLLDRGGKLALCTERCRRSVSAASVPC